MSHEVLLPPPSLLLLILLPQILHYLPGMATNIPPHNLGELCDAVVALVDDPLLSDEALFKIIPAPDFPTGGQIMGLAGAEELYRTGKRGEVLYPLCCAYGRLVFTCEHFLIVAV